MVETESRANTTLPDWPYEVEQGVENWYVNLSTINPYPNDKPLTHVFFSGGGGGVFMIERLRLKMAGHFMWHFKIW